MAAARLTAGSALQFLVQPSFQAAPQLKQNSARHTQTMCAQPSVRSITDLHARLAEQPPQPQGTHMHGLDDHLRSGHCCHFLSAASFSRLAVPSCSAGQVRHACKTCRQAHGHQPSRKVCA